MWERFLPPPVRNLVPDPTDREQLLEHDAECAVTGLRRLLSSRGVSSHPKVHRLRRCQRDRGTIRRMLIPSAISMLITLGHWSLVQVLVDCA